MPDSHLVTAFSAAITTAVGQKLVAESWETAKKWLKSYFEDHRPEAVTRANNSVELFFIDFLRRVLPIVEKAKQDPKVINEIDQILSDPDFSAVLQTAVLGAARTSSDQKRRLLARAVADRLTSKTDSTSALALNTACEAIPKLSEQHLRCLAILLPKEPGTAFDAYHIAATSSVVFSLSAVRAFHQILASNYQWDFCDDSHLAAFAQNTDVGQRLDKVWWNGLVHTYPTPAGRIIGDYTRQELLGEESPFVPDFTGVID